MLDFPFQPMKIILFVVAFVSLLSTSMQIGTSDLLTRTSIKTID